MFRDPTDVDNLVVDLWIRRIVDGRAEFTAVHANQEALWTSSQQVQFVPFAVSDAVATSDVPAA